MPLCHVPTAVPEGVGRVPPALVRVVCDEVSAWHLVRVSTFGSVVESVEKLGPLRGWCGCRGLVVVPNAGDQ
jgi:hypothetical protein